MTDAQKNKFWTPIVTAPKDGTIFRLSLSDGYDAWVCDGFYKITNNESGWVATKKPDGPFIFPDSWFPSFNGDYQ